MSLPSPHHHCAAGRQLYLFTTEHVRGVAETKDFLFCLRKLRTQRLALRLLQLILRPGFVVSRGTWDHIQCFETCLAGLA